MTIDLRTCQPGQILRLRNGSLTLYIKQLLPKDYTG